MRVVDGIWLEALDGILVQVLDCNIVQVPDGIFVHVVDGAFVGATPRDSTDPRDQMPPTSTVPGVSAGPSSTDCVPTIPLNLWRGVPGQRHKRMSQQRGQLRIIAHGLSCVVPMVPPTPAVEPINWLFCFRWQHLVAAV